MKKILLSSALLLGLSNTNVLNAEDKINFDNVSSLKSSSIEQIELLNKEMELKREEVISERIKKIDDINKDIQKNKEFLYAKEKAMSLLDQQTNLTSETFDKYVNQINSAVNKESIENIIPVFTKENYDLGIKIEEEKRAELNKNVQYSINILNSFTFLSDAEKNAYVSEIQSCSDEADINIIITKAEKTNDNNRIIKEAQERKAREEEIERIKKKLQDDFSAGIRSQIKDLSDVKQEEKDVILNKLSNSQLNNEVTQDVEKIKSLNEKNKNIRIEKEFNEYKNQITKRILDLKEVSNFKDVTTLKINNSHNKEELDTINKDIDFYIEKVKSIDIVNNYKYLDNVTKSSFNDRIKLTNSKSEIDNVLNDAKTKDDKIKSDIEKQRLQEIHDKLVAGKRKYAEQFPEDLNKAIEYSKNGFDLSWPAYTQVISWHSSEHIENEGLKAIDIAPNSDIDLSIMASASGKVTSAYFDNLYGNMIIIDHGNGLITRYGHLKNLEVNEGQQVKKGERIGSMGSTGNSTGLHLHFEVIDSSSGKTLNPEAFLK